MSFCVSGRSPLADLGLGAALADPRIMRQTGLSGACVSRSKTSRGPGGPVLVRL